MWQSKDSSKETRQEKRSKCQDGSQHGWKFLASAAVGDPLDGLTLLTGLVFLEAKGCGRGFGSATKNAGLPRLSCGMRFLRNHSIIFHHWLREATDREVVNVP